MDAEILEIAEEGGRHVLRGDWEAAARVYEEGMRQFPAAPYLTRNLGHSLLKLGRFSEAQAAYRQAITLQPEDAHSQHGLGAALAHELSGRNAAPEEYKECIETLKTAVGLSPHDASKVNDLAYAYRMGGDLEHAYFHYLRAVHLSPFDESYFHFMEEVLRLTDRHQDAIRAFESRVRADDVAPGLWYVLGRLHEADGDKAAAIRHFREAVLRAPTSPTINKHLNRLTSAEGSV